MSGESSPPPTDTPGLRTNRACRHCVQIKAKCIPSEVSNNICARCERLGRHCTTPAPVSRKQRANPTRVSRLEERITTLTDLLASKAATAIVPDYVTALNTSASTDSITALENVTGFPNGLWSDSIPTPPTSTVAPDGRGQVQEVQQVATILHGTGCGHHVLPAGTTDNDENFRVILIPALEEKLFNDFRTQLNTHYPFVVIPPQTTALEVRGAKPFLFRCCITAACHSDPYLAQQLSEDLIRYIGDRMLLRGEKSLDLLQGLLIFLAWYQYYSYFTPQLINPQVMNLLHLAIAMTTDLGLNRPSQPAVMAPIGLIIDIAQMIHGKLVNRGIQTSDDRRALLGVYCLSGQLSSCFRRLDPMRWTQHLEDCCTALLTAAEYPSDVYAVHLVRLHRSLEIYSPYIGLLKTSSVPIRTYTTCVQQDLGRFQKDLPAALDGNAYMAMQLHHAYICLYETIFLVEGDSAFHKAEALHDALNHISYFWDALDNIPSPCLPSLTFVFWLHVIHVVIIVAKLSFAIIDGWDVQVIRNSKVNFGSITDRFAAKLRDVSKQGPGNEPPPPNDPAAVRFSRYVEKMRLCKRWYESKIAFETDGEVIDPENGLQYDFTMADLFEGLGDDFWPQSL